MPDYIHTNIRRSRRISSENEMSNVDTDYIHTNIRRSRTISTNEKSNVDADYKRTNIRRSQRISSENEMSNIDTDYIHTNIRRSRTISTNEKSNVDADYIRTNIRRSQRISSENEKSIVDKSSTYFSTFPTINSKNEKQINSTRSTHIISSFLQKKSSDHEESIKTRPTFTPNDSNQNIYGSVSEKTYFIRPTTSARSNKLQNSSSLTALQINGEKEYFESTKSDVQTLPVINNKYSTNLFTSSTTGSKKSYDKPLPPSSPRMIPSVESPRAFRQIRQSADVLQLTKSSSITGLPSISLPSVDHSSPNNENSLHSLSLKSSIFNYPSIDHSPRSVHNIWGHVPTNYDKTDDNWGEKDLELILHPTIFNKRKERKNKINLKTKNLKLTAQMKSKSVSSIHIDYLYVKTSFGQFMFCA